MIKPASNSRSFFDCPKCHEKGGMVAINVTDFHKCGKCGKVLPPHYLMGYWKGWEDAKGNDISTREGPTEKLSKNLEHYDPREGEDRP